MLFLAFFEAFPRLLAAFRARFLAVNLMDRHMSLLPVLRRRLQLMGVVAMFVASKFEEIDPPRATAT